MSVYCGSRHGKKIEWIVCHYPAAPGKSAKWMYDYYNNCKRTVSAHYSVSPDGTESIVPCSMAAWHVATSGCKTYCGATNYNSIGIDLMDNKLSTRTLKVEDNDWYIHERTLDRATYLIAYLMKQYNIDIDHVVRHYDVTHKSCPRPLTGNDINKYYGISGNQRWAQFKKEIVDRL